MFTTWMIHKQFCSEWESTQGQLGKIPPEALSPKKQVHLHKQKHAQLIFAVHNLSRAGGH